MSIRQSLEDVKRKVVVRNTFLEPHEEGSDESEDFGDTGFLRASTEPVRPSCGFLDVGNFPGLPSLESNPERVPEPLVSTGPEPGLPQVLDPQVIDISKNAFDFGRLSGLDSDLQNVLTRPAELPSQTLSYSTRNLDRGGAAESTASYSASFSRNTTPSVASQFHVASDRCSSSDIEEPAYVYARQVSDEDMNCSFGRRTSPGTPPGTWAMGIGGLIAGCPKMPTAQAQPYPAAGQRAGPWGDDTFTSHNLTEMQRKLVDVGHVARAASQELSPMLAQEATVQAVQDMECAVTLADPAFPDCPLIACSDAFERLTGYTRKETLGQNCRFLNAGLLIDKEQRNRLREHTRSGKEFMEVVLNRRRNGEIFQNLLHLVWVCVRGKNYSVGIAADVTWTNVHMQSIAHRAAVVQIAERIFCRSIDAWVHVQAWEFSLRLPASYSLLLKKGSPDSFTEEQEHFVKVRTSDSEMSRQTTPFTRQATPMSDAGSSSSFSNFSAPVVPGLTQPARRAPTNVTPPQQAHRQNAQHNASVPTTQAVPPPPVPSAEVQGGAPLSKGSEQHPHGCVECSFHFFGPEGCRAGADCTFCHEFHPRRNPKKNRRILKRLSAQSDAPGEGAPSGGASTSATGSTGAQGPTSQEVSPRAKGAEHGNSGAPSTLDSNGSNDSSPKANTSTVESTSASTGSTVRKVSPGMQQHGSSPELVAQCKRGDDPRDSVQTSTSASTESGGGCGTQQPESSPQPTTPTEKKDPPRVAAATSTSSPTESGGPPRSSNQKLTISYIDADKQNNTLTLVVGVCIRLRVRLDWSSEVSRQALQDQLTFVADPPLPEGLQLDPKTGHIEGVPAKPQDFTVFYISARISAMGPGGISLGEISFATCALTINVVDIDLLTLGASCQDGGERSS